MTRYFTDYAWLGGAQVAERVLIDGHCHVNWNE